MSEVERFGPYESKRYSRLEQAQARRAFRRRYGCCNCLNEWDFDSCMEMGVCRYAPKPEPACLRTSDRVPCARNGGKLCPYENGSGTCFGFCIKEILQEHRERMARLQEQKADIAGRKAAQKPSGRRKEKERKKDNDGNRK